MLASPANLSRPVNQHGINTAPPPFSCSQHSPVWKHEKLLVTGKHQYSFIQHRIDGEIEPVLGIMALPRRWGSFPSLDHISVSWSLLVACFPSKRSTEAFCFSEWWGKSTAACWYYPLWEQFVVSFPDDSSAAQERKGLRLTCAYDWLLWPCWGAGNYRITECNELETTHKDHWIPLRPAQDTPRTPPCAW